MRDVTIQVSPYIFVRGTKMTMSMMLDAPAKGRTRVILNNEIYEGVEVPTVIATPKAA